MCKNARETGRIFLGKQLHQTDSKGFFSLREAVMKTKVMHQGTYKGTRLSELDIDYLWWLSHQSYCPDYVMEELSRRGGNIIKEGRNGKRRRKATNHSKRK